MLAEALESPSRALRRSAVDLLKPLGSHGAPAIPALVKLIKSDDSELRFLGATALGNIGGAAKSVKASLISSMDDSSPSVREAAAQALGCIEREEFGKVE